MSAYDFCFLILHNINPTIINPIPNNVHQIQVEEDAIGDMSPIPMNPAQ